MPWNRCKLCSEPATSRGAKYCLAHRAVGRRNAAMASSKATKRRWRLWKKAGIDPSHGGEAAAKRAGAVAESNRAKPRRKKVAEPAPGRNEQQEES